MPDIVSQTVYFEEPGPANTERTLQLALGRAQERGIGSIIVPSSRGETGVRAAALFEGFNLVVVTSSTGYTEPNVQRFPAGSRQTVLATGAHLLTATHAFGGIGRAVRRRLNTYQIDEIIAFTLRRFGDGLKVACEITLMAADAGLIRTDEDVIALGGTGRGLDTAIVLKPAHTQDFFELLVREIICKPRL
jgi:hypothetical protein